MSSSRIYPCLLCQKRTKPAERRCLTGDNNKHIRKYLQKKFFVSIGDNDVLCGRCRREYYTNTSKKGSAVVTNQPVRQSCFTNNVSPRNITLPLASIGGSHSTCCVCRKQKPKLIVVSSSVRFNCFLHKNIIIPSGFRCCPVHVADDAFTDEASNMLTQCRQSTDFNRTDIMSLLQNIRLNLLKKGEQKLNFDTSMTEADLKNLTGLDKVSFEDLLIFLTSVCDTQVRSARTCLGIFLTKMKTGTSNKVLSTLFNISKDSIRRSITSVRKNLLQTFTPQNIGFNHVTRETVISSHTRPLAQTLFGKGLNPALLVIDGTYIYIQKSSKFRFQRRSYSLHKHRPLIKPMVFVTTTGYFVSVLGPYLSDYHNNDANILKHIFATDTEEIKNWTKEGDVFVVDRGFRDSVEFLNDLGIKSEMPAFLNKGQKQLSTEQSNSSRLVTKIRWVVESANARLKSWKYFDRVLPNSQIPFVGDYIQIICSICNKYFPPLSSGIREEDEIIGSKMLYLAKQNNVLKLKIENENINKIKSSSWKKMESEDISFPSLTEEDMRALTIGVYQVNLAKSYTQEHLNDNSDFEVFVSKLDPNFISVKLQSRHISSKVYLLWIMFDSCSVLSWYCKCRVGSRVVGMCSHVASVIWFLGYGRRESNQFSPLLDWTKFLKDATDMPEPETVDSDEDDDEFVEE